MPYKVRFSFSQLVWDVLWYAAALTFAYHVSVPLGVLMAMIHFEVK